MPLKANWARPRQDRNKYAGTEAPTHQGSPTLARGHHRSTAQEGDDTLLV